MSTGTKNTLDSRSATCRVHGLGVGAGSRGAQPHGIRSLSFPCWRWHGLMYAVKRQVVGRHSTEPAAPTTRQMAAVHTDGLLLAAPSKPSIGVKGVDADG